MSKYTPGPWKTVDCPSNVEIHSPSGQCLADVWSYDLDYSDEMRANATLMADAPELLGALEAIIACNGYSIVTCDAERVFENAKNLIARARGEA